MSKKIYFLIVIIVIIIAISYYKWSFGKIINTNSISLEDNIKTNLDKDTSEKLYLAIDDARKELGAPSLQVSVIVDGDKEWNGSVGWSKPRDKETAKLNDLYHIGSVSKIYTSTLTMKLIEEGYLSLDDPVSMYVEDIPNGDKIKIRHLLNHTSGLYNYTEDRMFTFKTIFQKEWTIDDVLDIARENESLFEPGTDHYYSNTNYVLLSVIAQEVTGNDFTSLLEEQLFIPLELNSTYESVYNVVPENTAQGYDISLTPLGKLGIKTNMEHIQESLEYGSLGAGTIVSTSSDVNRFTYSLFDGQIIDDNSLDMMTNFIDVLDEDVPEQTGYGFGLRRLVIDGQELWGHTGTFPGYSNVSMYSKEHDYAITVLSNLSMSDVNYVLEKVQTIIISDIKH